MNAPRAEMWRPTADRIDAANVTRLMRTHKDKL